MTGHEQNQIKEWADILKDERVEMFIFWQWGEETVFCGVGIPNNSGKMFQINDPYNPIDNLAPMDPT